VLLSFMYDEPGRQVLEKYRSTMKAQQAGA
jgi:hypothetical protein